MTMLPFRIASSLRWALEQFYRSSDWLLLHVPRIRSELGLLLIFVLFHFE